METAAPSVLPPLGRIAAGRVRTSSCRACGPCTREDCGTCVACLDKPKFGGPGTRKQLCLLRRCENRRVRSKHQLLARCARVLEQAPSVFDATLPTTEAVFADATQLAHDSAPADNVVARVPPPTFEVMGDAGGMNSDEDAEADAAAAAAPPQTSSAPHTTTTTDLPAVYVPSLFPPAPGPGPAPAPAVPSEEGAAPAANAAPAAGTIDSPPARPRSQRRSAGLASYAWRAVHESERAARREACDASARIVPRAAPPRAVPTAQRSNGTARPPTMPEADVPEAQRESAGAAGAAGTAGVARATGTAEGLGARPNDGDSDGDSEGGSELEVWVDVEGGQAAAVAAGGDGDDDECEACGWAEEEEEEEEGIGLDADFDDDAVALAVDSDDEDDGAGVGVDSMWLQLELRCSLTLQRLTDPARGDACLHPPKCNYEVHTPLREPASLCPGAIPPMQM